uniref:ARAD1B22946p n=1 Tax=Blastobotrys adeninivorans TaxID=409370 RepID=A0A060TD99_BLAAD
MAPTTRSKAKKENVGKDVAEAGSVFFQVLENYFDTAPTRIRLIDTFLLFLMIIGIQQFVFCLIFGTYVRFFDSLARMKCIRVY